MKKHFLLLVQKYGLQFTAILFTLLLFSGQSKGLTPGTLTFTINPVAHPTASYTPRHLAAVWIETASGTFVKTRNRYTGTSNQSHLANWNTACAYSVVDATAGATLTTYTPVTITPWTGNDIAGTTPYNLVPDGNYRVAFEFAWDDPNGPTTRDIVYVPFTKGPNAVNLTPAYVTNFTGMSLT